MDIIRGDIDLWADTFPHHLVPDVLEMLLSAWEAFNASDERPKSDEHEVPITQRFRPFLIKDKNMRTLPFTIGRESVEDDLESGEEKGRIDIRLRHGYREEVYLAFECKRLNVMLKDGLRSLASEYVSQGMMRFITEQYSINLPEGGMIGYVLNGDVNDAMNKIDKSIRNKCTELNMEPPGGLVASSIIPENEQIQETLHHLDADFLMHHVFLAVSIS
jgi:ACT domain-containing protein